MISFSLREIAEGGLVQRSVFEAVVEKVQARARGIVVGDPLDAATHVGPLCTAAQVSRIVTTLAAARDQGAEIVFGGAPLDRGGASKAAPFAAPTRRAQPGGALRHRRKADGHGRLVCLEPDAVFARGAACPPR